jgi:NitT/TauT family transport system ATP-binding protein
MRRRVLIFTGRPGSIKKEITIDLPRPRDINDADVSEYAARITAELEESDAIGGR